MAERRMFAKTIIDSDAFLDMPLSAQALYFHLSMRADDDGFVNNPKRIQKVIGSNDDDYNVLIMKRFILTFDSGIIVIKHWKIHNYIRQDRKKDTTYPDEMALLEEKDNGAYTFRNDLLPVMDNEIPEIEESNNTKMNYKDARKMAYEESSLPYSFDYKIRQAFWGKPCPICGISMGLQRDGNMAIKGFEPSIQHNIPISKGGKHELGNISVICHKCNVSIKDTETGRLNADEVIEVWDCLSSDGQMSGKCQANVSVNKLPLFVNNNKPLSSPKSKPLENNIPKLLQESEIERSVKEKISEWLTYKTERKEGYKTQGFKSLLSVVQKNVDKYGADAVCEVIDLSMSNQWQGILWKRLEETNTKPRESAYMQAIKDRVNIVDTWT